MQSSRFQYALRSLYSLFHNQYIKQYIVIKQFIYVDPTGYAVYNERDFVHTMAQTSTVLRRQAGRPSRRLPVSPADIVERVTAAIAEHRLPPGAKLGEESLGEVFGVSRTKVREALFQLAKDKLVSLHPGRGAFVARPGVREAREIFEARRVLERALIFRVTHSAAAADLERLRAHIERERGAIAAKDTRAGTRLSGEFHSMIADMAGNAVLAEILRELVSRTSLIIVLYESSLPASCSCDEHTELLARIETRDAEGAMRLMSAHLDHIERSLRLKDDEPAAVDLKAVLSGAS